MKKLVLAASIAVLGLSAQAANTTSSSGAASTSTAAPASTSSTSATPASTTTATTTAAPAAAPAKTEKAPEDTAETKMFIQNYPELVKRISPVGKVCEVGQKCSVPAQQPMAPGGSANVGEMVYQNVCTNCHAAGMLGAPKFEDKADWAPRIAKGKSTLYDHAIKGFNQMPAKGGDAQLSDADVKSAVDYIVTKSS